MNNKSEADPVCHYMMPADEPIKFIHPRLQQRKFEQRPTKRHQRVLNRRYHPISFLDRILRAHQVIASELNFRVITRFLENLPVRFKKGNSKRFGFAHHLDDRALK